MPKAKLNLPASTNAKKLHTAAELSGVKLGESKTILDDLIVEATFKNPSDLLKMGRLMERVTGNELDAVAVEAPAKAKAGK